MFLTARETRGLSHGCWAVSHVLWSVRELPTRAEGPGRWRGSEPREGPWGSLSPLGSRVLFLRGGLSFPGGKAIYLPPAHCVGSIIVVWEEMIMSS